MDADAAATNSAAAEEGDSYAVLGVPRGADQGHLRRAYHNLALKLHPDKDPSKAVEFEQLQAAWQQLGSAEARAAYDERHRPEARAVVWRDVALGDFSPPDGPWATWTFACRCGGVFEVFTDEPCADGDLVPCDGCSSHVRLVM